MEQDLNIGAEFRYELAANTTGADLTFGGKNGNGFELSVALANRITKRHSFGTGACWIGSIFNIYTAENLIIAG